MPQLILKTVEGPEPVTGGAFRPEADLIMLPVLLLGATIIKWYTINRDPRIEIRVW